MRKFLIIGGILLIIAGFAGTMYGAFSGIMGFTNDAINATENAERFCVEGETLVTNEGASSYTPGQGYGRTVSYFCENENGVRRDVTGEFVQGLFGGFGDIFSSSFAFTGVIMIGVLMLIVGILWSVMRRINNPPRLLTPTYPINNTPFGGQPSMPMQYPQPPSSNPAYAKFPPDLALRMQQLDEAKNGRFVTPAEYEQERQRIYDELRSRGL